MHDYRYDHASFSVGKYWVYVLCGRITQFEDTDTIERLDTGSIKFGWELIQLPYGKTDLKPRSMLGAAPLNKHEFVLFGGDVDG